MRIRYHFVPILTVVVSLLLTCQKVAPTVDEDHEASGDIGPEEARTPSTIPRVLASETESHQEIEVQIGRLLRPQVESLFPERLCPACDPAEVEEAIRTGAAVCPPMSECLRFEYIDMNADGEDEVIVDPTCLSPPGALGHPLWIFATDPVQAISDRIDLLSVLEPVKSRTGHFIINGYLVFGTPADEGYLHWDGSQYVWGGEEVYNQLTAWSGEDPSSSNTDTVFATVNASSSLAPRGANRYDPENLFDGNIETAWSESVPGTGSDEFLQIDFDHSIDVSALEVWNGYQSSVKKFTDNGRVTVVNIATYAHIEGNTYRSIGEERFELADTMGAQRLDFHRPVRASRVRLVIVAAKSGARYDDVLLSEIVLHGPDGSVPLQVDEASNDSRGRTSSGTSNSDDQRSNGSSTRSGRTGGAVFDQTACESAAGFWYSDGLGSTGCWFFGEESQSCDTICGKHSLNCDPRNWNVDSSCGLWIAKGVAIDSGHCISSAAAYSPNNQWTGWKGHDYRVYRTAGVNQDCASAPPYRENYPNEPGCRSRVCVCNRR